MFKNLSDTTVDNTGDGWYDITLEDSEDKTIEVTAQQHHSSINNLNNLVGGGSGGNSSSGLRRRKPNSDAEFYPSTSNEQQNSVYLPALNLGMMMVSRVQQAFSASSPPQSPPSTKSDAQHLQTQLEQLRKQYTELGNQYQQVQGLAVYYQNLHQCGEKQLQEALLRHNDERKGLDELIKKAADERGNLEAKCEEEIRHKLAVESELKDARHLIECFKGRKRSSSIDSLDTESSFSCELTRANEMVEVLRNQLKRSEEQLAVRSVTSDDLFEDVHLNQEEKLQHLQEFVEKLKSSRRRKVDQILQLCEALNVAGANCDELRENLMRTRDSNKKKKAKIEQLTQASEQLRLQLARLQAEIDEKNAEIESESVAWQQRVDVLEVEHGDTERAMKELHAIEMTEMDAKLKEFAFENTKIVEHELHLAEERNSTCDRLREALESLEKLEVECTSTSGENATLRDQLDRYEAVRHEESSAMRSEIGKCESQLLQNQQTISRLRDRNLHLLDQEHRARELQRAEVDECARKSATDEAEIGQLRTENHRASLASNAQLDELKTRVSSLEAELSARDDVIKEMQTRLDEQGRYAEWCEGRMRHFEGVCCRLHEDACRFYHDARKHFEAAVSLQRDNDQLRGWYQQQRHHHYGGRMFEFEKSEKLDRILEEMEPTSSEDERPTTPPGTPALTTDPDFCPGQSSTPLAKSAAPTLDANKQSRKLFTTLKLEPAPEVEEFKSKRERRVAQLRQLPIWRRENPDNWNADLSFCYVSSSSDDSDVIASGASVKSSSASSQAC